LLRQYNPSIDQALLRLADIAREDNGFIEGQASGLWDEVARQENKTIYLDRAVTRLVGDLRDIEATHIEAARSLLDKSAGKISVLPHDLTCQAGYNELVIASTARQSQFPPCPFPSLPDELHLKVPGKTARLIRAISLLTSTCKKREGISASAALAPEIDFSLWV
jgi:hypothetical protein